MMRKKFAGFTLIELLIVLVILGILMAIVVPSYTEYMRKAARAQAKAKILDLVQMEERFFTNNATYQVVPVPSPVPAGWESFSGSDQASRKYDITVVAGPTGIATSFTITATPSNGFSDPVCGDLSVNSAGLKSSSVSGSSCW